MPKQCKTAVYKLYFKAVLHLVQRHEPLQREAKHSPRIYEVFLDVLREKQKEILLEM
jgi:hypothetical protein